MSALFKKIRFIIWSSVHLQPRWAIGAWQRFRFAKIVKHARKCVPFYRELWARHGLGSSTSPLSGSDRLPVVERKDFQRQPESYYTCTGLPASFYTVRGRTSGSTGNPFHFICPSYDDGSEETERRYFFHKRWRFLVWRGADMKESLETMRVLKFKMRRTSSDPHSFFVDPDAFSRNPEKLLHEIIDFSPDIIVCYTSALVEFCSTLKTNGLSGLLSIRFAVSSGEVLTETQRTLAHEVLGCEVYNRYGLEEFYRTVGVECQEHHGFHLNAESFLLEVVDERGNSLSNGSSGRIIITDLYNRAMPFIRYDTGDIGTILPDPCPCGVETERFTIEGRLAHLRLGDESINYVDINRVVTLRAGAILQWQVHKLEEKRLAFFLVQGPAFNDRIATELMDVLRKLLPTTDVEISYVDAITQDSGKKVRLFVDHTA